MTNDLMILRATSDDLPGHLDALTAILHACVADGASVGFVMPFAPETAAAWWQSRIFPAVAAGQLGLWLALVGGRAMGTVQLDHDTPPNQPHRAELRKMLVHPLARRRGLARALIAAAEDGARALGRSLITLDTRTGDKAEPLYASCGYQVAGVIPDWCRDTLSDRLDATTIMYKRL